jgi:16S rRNA processing protein RimM
VTTSPTAVVGRVRRVHGIKGELLVSIETDAPDAIFAPGARLFARLPQGGRDANAPALRPLTVSNARTFKDGLLVQFEGIADRTEAERWCNVTLLVPMDEIEPPAEGELWLHELQGMRALDAQGATLGEVRGYYEVPQGIVLEVITALGVRDVPFNDAFVVGFDRTARVITLDVPDGLLE